MEGKMIKETTERDENIQYGKSVKGKISKPSHYGGKKRKWSD